MFLGIDVGRSATKVAMPGKVLTFPSVVGEGRDLRLGDPRDFQVELSGQRYFVGDLAEESFSRREMATESKLHDETRILFLTALASARPGSEATITTGLPVDQHRPDVKDALTRLLTGHHTVVLNGAPVEIHLEEVNVVPEGAGAFWAEVLNDQGRIVRPDLLKGRVRILDLGSRTTNYLTLVDGRYLDRDSGTLGYGLFELDRVGAADFCRRIIADLAKRLPDLKISDHVLLAGGGAVRLGSHLMRHFTAVETVGNPVEANALGYRRLGMVRRANANR